MAAFLNAINQFPEGQFWRIRGEKDVTHFCGGISSFLVLLGVITILVLKVKDSFKMDQTDVQYSIESSLQSASVDLLTSSSDPLVRPVMMGLSFPQANMGNYIIQVSHNNGATFSAITMEQCTTSHFPITTNQDISKYLQFNNTLCLPLNQNYSLGGNRFQTSIRSEKQKTLWFDITCNGSCNAGNVIDFITMASTPNPGDPLQSWSSSLYRKRLVTSSTEQRIYADVINTYITKQVSIYPFQKKETSIQGLVLDKNFESEVYPTSSSVGSIKIIVGSSTEVIQYTQTFISILDALAYVGGVYFTLLAIFFFVPSYSDFYLELSMGKRFLKKASSISTGFLTYMKDELASSLQSLGANITWEGVQDRQKIRDCVNKMLDIVYLQKRISFLERSLTILLEEHQLKSLYLLHGQSSEEIQENLKNHSLRNRFLMFLSKKKSQKAQDNIENAQHSPDLAGSGAILHKEVQIEPQLSKQHHQKAQKEQHENSSRNEFETETEEYQPQQISEVQGEVLASFKLLFKEAETKTDIRSSMIIAKLDEKIKNSLISLLREQEQARLKPNHDRMNEGP